MPQPTRSELRAGQPRLSPLQSAWMIFAYILHWCVIGASIMIIVGQAFVMDNTITRFKEVFVKGQKDRGWRTGDDYNPMCGYVQLTSIPKHLGSIVWALGWQVFIILAAIILIFADLAMAIPERNNIFWRMIKMFWLDGMTYTEQYGTANPYEGTSRDPIPFFLAPLAFFKIFITFGYMSQTFYGVDNGMNQWGEQTGPNTQEFCVYAGLILGGSSLLGLMTGTWIYQVRNPKSVSTEHGRFTFSEPPRGDWPSQGYKDMFY